MHGRADKQGRKKHEYIGLQERDEQLQHAEADRAENRDASRDEPTGADRSLEAHGQTQNRKSTKCPATMLAKRRTANTPWRISRPTTSITQISALIGDMYQGRSICGT